MKFEYFNIPIAGEKFVPTMELRSIEDIEPFSIKKEKLQLPKHNDSPKGKFTCFLNTSKEEICEILNNVHPMILNHGSSYKGYYYDYLKLKTGIISSRIKNPGKMLNELKMERLEDYGIIQDLSANTMTPITIATLAEKNFIYDLEPLTRLMQYQQKLKKIPLIERLTMYFTSIGKLYGSLNYEGYSKGPIFINLDEYNPKSQLTDYSFYDYLMILLF